MTRDWFRSESWNPPVQAEFKKRLQRVRSRFNQAQYLTIQGSTLLASPQTAVQQEGVQLLRRVFSEYSDEPKVAAHAHEVLAGYFQRNKSFADAEREYREVLRYYETTPSRTFTSGLADLSLVEVILDAGASNKYEEAEALMRALAQRPRTHGMLNSDLFRYHAAFARMLSRTGKRSEAARYAALALKVAEIQTPQFPRHPTVGIPTASQEIVRELQSICSPLVQEVFD